MSQNNTHDSSSLRPLTAADNEWVATFMRTHWDSEFVVVHGQVYRPAKLPGFVVTVDGEQVGLLTYVVVDKACEIVTINATRPNQGIGTTLMNAVVAQARAQGCRRLWLITTNDNLAALRFYQRRGFALAALHRGAIARSRQIKPDIPLVGQAGISIRDELELELIL